MSKDKVDHPSAYHLDKRAGELISLAPGRDPHDLLNTKQVAQWLGVSTQFLEIARHKGRGPTFVRISDRRIRYRRIDVLAFLEQRIFAGTGEYQVARGGQP